MRLLYADGSVCPAGLQKIGVTTTGPVDGVPITGPLCQMSGGVPFAASLVVCAQLPIRAGRMMPLKCPTRTAPRTLHGAAACDARCTAGCAEAPAADIALARRPAASTAKGARRRRPKRTPCIFPPCSVTQPGHNEQRRSERACQAVGSNRRHCGLAIVIPALPL